MENKKCVGRFDTSSLPNLRSERLIPFRLLPDSRLCFPVGSMDLYKSMPDDHSKLVPPLPIPNRTVKQLCADDSAATSVKVGYRQASYIKKPLPLIRLGLFFVYCFHHQRPERAQDRVQCRRGLFFV